MAEAQGNIEKVAKHLKMPESTLRSWINAKDQNGKEPARNDPPPELYDENKAHLTQLLDIAIRDAMQELPGKWSEATARDIAVAVGIFTDKLQLLTGEPTESSRQQILIQYANSDDNAA